MDKILKIANVAKIGDIKITGDFFINNENSLTVRMKRKSADVVRISPANDGETWDLSDDKFVLAFDFINITDINERIDVTFYSGNSKSTYITCMPPRCHHTHYCVLNEEMRELGVNSTIPVHGGKGIIQGRGVIVGRSPEDKDVAFDTSKIECVEISSSLNGAGYFTFENFQVTENPIYDYKTVHKGICDEFGQYTRKEWPNKVHSEEELLAFKKAEDLDNDKFHELYSAKADRTIYGGYKNDKYRQEATGHFYPKKIGRKWMLIDPEGYPFFSTGMDIVRQNGTLTTYTTREYMFENIPAQDGELGSHYSKYQGVTRLDPRYKDTIGYSFYTANLQRKYGEDWLNKWGENSARRFKAWGLTSMGAWSEPELFHGRGEEHKCPYAGFVWTHGDHQTLHHKLPDVFDPMYIETVQRTLKEQATDFNVQNDPYCYGVFVDNEYIWELTFDDNPFTKSVFICDCANEKSYAKRHFMGKLKAKYENIENLNKAWGTEIASFEELEKPYVGKFSEEDSREILVEIADTYYSIIRREFKKVMPNTLYLGSRNTEFGTAREITQVAVKYVDVLSFNCYRSDVVQERFYLEEYDMPIIVGEFDFASNELGMYGPITTSRIKDQDRGDAYVKYVRSALAHENFVGVHWFQYYDEPLLGRGDGENFNTGFVDVCDIPYKSLVDASREVYETMYDVAFNQVDVTNVTIKDTQYNLAKVGDSVKLELAIEPSTLGLEEINFYSSNLLVATVDKNGVITATGEGSAVICARARYGLYVKTSTVVTVNNKPANDCEEPVMTFRFDEDVKNLTLKVGECFDFKDKVTIYPSTETPKLTWTSSKVGIASITKDGLMTAHKKGEINLRLSDSYGYAVDSVRVVIE